MKIKISELKAIYDELSECILFDKYKPTEDDKKRVRLLGLFLKEMTRTRGTNHICTFSDFEGFIKSKNLNIEDLFGESFWKSQNENYYRDQLLLFIKGREETKGSTKRDLLKVSIDIKKKILSFLPFYLSQINMIRLNKQWNLLTEYTYEGALRTYMPKIYREIKHKIIMQEETTAILKALMPSAPKVEAKSGSVEETESNSIEEIKDAERTNSTREAESQTAQEVQTNHEIKLQPAEETKSTQETKSHTIEESKSDAINEVVPVYRPKFIALLEKDYGLIKEEVKLPDQVEKGGIFSIILAKEDDPEQTIIYGLWQTLSQQKLDTIYKIDSFTVDRKQGVDFKIDKLSFSTSLQLAILCKQPTQELRRLLTDEKKDPNQVSDYLDKTPCMLAAETGQLDVLKLLLEHKADIAKKTYEDNEDNTGYDALYFAVVNGHVEVVKHFLDSITLEKKNDLLKHAIQSEQLEIVKLLLESGADVDTQVSLVDKNWYNDVSAIEYAVSNLQADIVKLLIEKGAKVIFKNEDGSERSLMQRAISCGDLSTVKLLVEHKADLNTPNCDDRTPLNFAIVESQLPIIKYLAEQKSENPESALLLAIRLNRLDVLIALIIAGLNLNKLFEHKSKKSTGIISFSSIIPQKNYDLKLLAEKITPLEYAIMAEDRLPIVELLVRHGAKVLGEDNKEVNPALIAVRNNNLPVLKFFLKKGANANELLIPAAKYGNDEIFNLIMSYNPDVNRADEKGDTALDCAVAAGEQLKINALVRAGAQFDPNEMLIPAIDKGTDELALLAIELKADVNHADAWGTSLMHAAEGGRSAQIKALIAAGAILEKVDSKGQTALYKAAAKGHDEVIKLILEHKTQENLVGPLWASIGADMAHIKANCMKALLQHKPDLLREKHPEDGATLLMFAVRHGYANNVDALIQDFKVDIEEKIAATGETAILYGIRYGKADIIKHCLLPHGANMYAVNKEGLNSMQLAVKLDHDDIVKRLFKKGFNIGGIEGAKKLFEMAQSNNVKRIILKNVLEHFIEGDEKPRQDSKSQASANAFISRLSRSVTVFRTAVKKQDASKLLQMLNDRSEIDDFIKFKKMLYKHSPLIWVCDMAIQLLQSVIDKQKDELLTGECSTFISLG